MKYFSTRNKNLSFSFKDIFLRGLAPDGGLFLPSDVKKYSESEINAFILSDEKIVLSIEIDDKYGSSGLTGLAILCKKLSKIDTLLLSCRVLGRNIEYKFMEIVVNIANKQNIKSINSKYTKTQKNHQVKDFYSRCGFNVIAKSDNTTRYRLEAISYKKKEIEYIRIKNGI